MAERLKIAPPKLSLPTPGESFPRHLVPPPGTPGGKSKLVEFALEWDGGSITATLKGAQLQRLVAAMDAAPQGGWVVFQGRLGPGNTLAEAGVIFQPNKTGEADGE